MQQVLFFLPIHSSWWDARGVPVYGFGAMLFVTFVVTAMIWGPSRGRKVGMPDGRMIDLAIVLFASGIAGARLLYMLQYRNQFSPDWGQFVWQFFQFQKGGIVVYGAVFGGLIGYTIFYRRVLRHFKISGWKLADSVAPLIATGLAIGRIGCYLNGCCWGQPACVECQTVPLSPELGRFPLLPAHAREQVCLPPGPTTRMPQIHGLQTSTGFSIAPRLPLGAGDPRTLVLAVEPDSAAAAAGLKAGDRIVAVNGEPNSVVVEILGEPSQVNAAAKRLTDAGATALPPAEGEPTDGYARLGIDDPATATTALAGLRALREAGTTVAARDRFTDLVDHWPRGDAQLTLGVNRGDAVEMVNFTPRTVGFFPTQLYETVSMALLVLVLIAFQPLRRHDGQMMVLLMLGYAAHRFLNEALRIEPTYMLDLTLSQWISVGIFAAGLALGVYLRLTMPKLPAGPQPLSVGVTPLAPTPVVAPA
jgi:phosphatidylglycerol:prolipoprotein diacylglycerol transferase